MKNLIKLSSYLLLTAVLAIGFTGCQKTCDEWYELDDNDCIEIRIQYYGTYVGTVTVDGQSLNAYMEIGEYSGDVQRLRVEGEGSVYLELSSESTFNIPLQNSYSSQGTVQVEGSGSFSGSQLVLNYLGTYQGQTTTVSFTGTR